ncbi:hypothetical protein V6N12_064532 [Hibiscus sabdariffa]|uniref:ABC-2 type transporter transmembrane domain-containing protein n=1 Tax=Hibiscus sabdariffa TaxID=183260 RepID=A0ABR2G7E9_9ROSI
MGIELRLVKLKPHVKDTEEEEKSVKDALISAYKKNISTRLKAELCSTDVNNYRGVRERRYDAFNKLRIFQVINVVVLGGLLWWHTPAYHISDRIALLFFFSVFWGFYPLYNAVFTFPQERTMLIKEQSSDMYRLSSYFLARTFSDLPLELALPTTFFFIIYWMGGLKLDLVTFILSLLIVLYSVLISQSLGLAFGAILMDIKQATTRHWPKHGSPLTRKRSNMLKDLMTMLEQTHTTWSNRLFFCGVQEDGILDETDWFNKIYRFHWFTEFRLLHFRVGRMILA